MRNRKHLSAVAMAAALALVACGGGVGESSPKPQASQTPVQTESPAADIVVVTTVSLDYEPSEFEVEAGTISVAMTNEGGPHTFTVLTDQGRETVAQVFNPGETVTGEIELEAGTYTFFCFVPEHRAKGMEGTLTVT